VNIAPQHVDASIVLISVSNSHFYLDDQELSNNEVNLNDNQDIAV